MKNGSEIQAREIRRIIRRYAENPISDHILQGAKEFTLCCENGGLAVKTPQLSSI